MTRITFLIDDDQWRSAFLIGARERRHPEVGDFIAVQLIFHLSDTMKWGPPRPMVDLRKQIVQIRDELTYFNGQTIDSSRFPFGEREDELSKKVLWEFMIDCGIPINAIGIIRENDPPPLTMGGFSEGLAPLWGAMSFHGGHLLKPVTGAIEEIRELHPVPMSTGPEVLRLFTIDISKKGPALIEPYKVDPLRRQIKG